MLESSIDFRQCVSMLCKLLISLIAGLYSSSARDIIAFKVEDWSDFTKIVKTNKIN